MQGNCGVRQQTQACGGPDNLADTVLLSRRVIPPLNATSIKGVALVYIKPYLRGVFIERDSQRRP